MRLAPVVVLVGSFLAATGPIAEARDGADPRGPEPPVMVVMPPPPEAPPPEPLPPPPPPPQQALKDGGVSVAMGTLLFRPALGQTMFNGSGTPLGGSRRESFRHAGRELGLDTPLMWGGELSAHYVRRYFAAGVMGFVVGHPGSEDRGTSPAYSPPADQVSAGALSGYGGGIDLAGALPLGPLAFRAGGVLGVRAFSLPMSGFEKKTCRGKRGNYPCSEEATTHALLFFEPRVRVEITPGRSMIFFGGYVGMEVVGGSGPTAGLFFGFHTPHSNLQP